MTIVQQIVSSETDAVIVYESDNVIAFADHDPINWGHILICPKEPFETFVDLPDSIHFEIQTVAKDLYARIVKKFNPDGISFIQNNGTCNELSHYHLHIFPRFDCDKFGWVSSGIGIQNIDALRKSLSGL